MLRAMRTFAAGVLLAVTSAFPIRYPTAYPTAYPTRYSARYHTGTTCRVIGVRNPQHNDLVGEFGQLVGQYRMCSGCGKHGQYSSCLRVQLFNRPSNFRRSWNFCESDVICTIGADDDNDGNAITARSWSSGSADNSEEDNNDKSLRARWESLISLVTEHWILSIVATLGAVFLLCLLCACCCRRGRHKRRTRQQRRGPPLPARQRIRSASSLSTQILSPATIRDLQVMDSRERVNPVVAHATGVSPPLARASSAAGAGARGGRVAGRRSATALRRDPRLAGQRGTFVPTVPVAMALVLRPSEELSTDTVPVAASVPIVGAVTVPPSLRAPSTAPSAVIAIV